MNVLIPSFKSRIEVLNKPKSKIKGTLVQVLNPESLPVADRSLMVCSLTRLGAKLNSLIKISEVKFKYFTDPLASKEFPFICKTYHTVLKTNSVEDCFSTNVFRLLD